MSKEFLGRGWKFPIEVDKTTGRIKTVSDEEDIKESLMLILNTAKGERVMRKDFGSKVNDFVFESLNATSVNLLKKEIKKAILEWEPRVTNVSVIVTNDRVDKTRLNIDIGYRVRSTNNLFNLVYPFYITEGTKTE